MKAYTKIKFLRILGAPVYIHWSALLVIGGLLGVSISNPPLAIISMCSYFGIILLHESGHAFFARKYGFTVTKIQLGFIHGKCEYEVPYDEFYELSDIVISWGGVIAQLIVAIPLIAIAQLSDIEHIYGMGPIVAFLGYISFMVAIVNLAPSEGLDGAIAWKIVPYILQNRSKAERNIKKPQYRSRPQAPEEIVRDFISRMKDDK